MANIPLTSTQIILDTESAFLRRFNQLCTDVEALVLAVTRMANESDSECESDMDMDEDDYTDDQCDPPATKVRASAPFVAARRQRSSATTFTASRRQ